MWRGSPQAPNLIKKDLTLSSFVGPCVLNYLYLIYMNDFHFFMKVRRRLQLQQVRSLLSSFFFFEKSVRTAQSKNTPSNSNCPHAFCIYVCIYVSAARHSQLYNPLSHSKNKPIAIAPIFFSSLNPSHLLLSFPPSSFPRAFSALIFTLTLTLTSLFFFFSFLFLHACSLVLDSFACEFTTPSPSPYELWRTVHVIDIITMEVFFFFHKFFFSN